MRVETRKANCAFFVTLEDHHLRQVLAPESCAPGRSRGVDVDEQGDGVLDDGRLYQLVLQQDAVRERTLEIISDDRGAEAYVFTFG